VLFATSEGYGSPNQYCHPYQYGPCSRCALTPRSSPLKETFIPPFASRMACGARLGSRKICIALACGGLAGTASGERRADPAPRVTGPQPAVAPVPRRPTSTLTGSRSRQSGPPSDDVNRKARAGVVQELYGGPNGIRTAGSNLWSQGSQGIADAAAVRDQFGCTVSRRLQPR
jgi:hypothetical protein